MYNKINWILGINNVKLLVIWFKYQYLYVLQIDRKILEKKYKLY